MAKKDIINTFQEPSDTKLKSGVEFLRRDTWMTLTRRKERNGSNEIILGLAVIAFRTMRAKKKTLVTRMNESVIRNGA
jgi:hypothetical protein